MELQEDFIPKRVSIKKKKNREPNDRWQRRIEKSNRMILPVRILKYSILNWKNKKISRKKNSRKLYGFFFCF